jgi:hypothetical protein
MRGTLPPEIGVLKFMTSFISFYNYIKGTIPTSLGLITHLQTFDIEGNFMNGELLKPEYAGANGLKEIVNFKASSNSFTGSIPTEIGLWTNLQNLAIYDNELMGTIFQPALAIVRHWKFWSCNTIKFLDHCHRRSFLLHFQP